MGQPEHPIERMPVPKISVLLPVYNAVRFLPAALESIAKQDAKDTELVVVDDGSSDGSLEAAAQEIERWGIPSNVCRFRYNLGVTAALKFGLDRCDCQYVARQDADDVSLPGRLRFQAEFLDNSPGVVALGTRVRILDEAGVPVRRGARMRWMPKAQIVVGRNPMYHGAVMFRRDAAEQVGGYLSCFEAAQDLSLWLRMARIGRLKVLPYTLYGLRAHPGRVSVMYRERQAAYAGLAMWAWGMGGSGR